MSQRVSSVIIRRPSVIPNHLCCLSDIVVCDRNDPSKNMGFLAHESTNFEFCGPDRTPAVNNTIDDYIKMATVIRDTKLPNYKMARCPVCSKLNLDAWCRYLHNYHDKQLIQYSTFGFPLSIQDDSNLHKTDITNHHSVIQFPGAIFGQRNSDGGHLGPFSESSVGVLSLFPSSHSPHRCRQEESHLRSFIPSRGVNDAVSRDKFDDTTFTLRFPTVDYIVDNIRHNKGELLLAKIDIARAFRNLRVDPADTFKFGIRWGDQYYLDVGVHGSASFQMTSDAILHIMRKESCAILPILMISS